MGNSKTSVSFITGHSPTKGLLGLLAYPSHMQGTGAEFTRFYTTRDGQWGQMPFHFDSRSLSYLIKDGYKAWWILGKRGEVVSVEQGRATHESIADAGTGPGKLGYLNKIAVINEQLYACGYHQQVYSRDNGQWVHMDEGVLDHSVGATFESMDGGSCDDIYAIGGQGAIWHYNGTSWHQSSSPTDRHLLDIKYVDSNEVYICGKDGILLRGTHNNWEVLQNKSNLSDLWGIEFFESTVYVSGFEGLAKVVGQEIVNVRTGQSHPFASYKLTQSEGLLWSVGTEDLWYANSDGEWTELICPDQPSKD